MHKPTSLAVMAVTVALVTAACGGSAASKSTAGGGASANEPIRVALVTPQSGPYAQYGEQQQAGVQFAAKQANAAGGIDGRKVEIYTADSGGTPETAVVAVERLVQQNKAKFVIGTIATPVTLAVMQRLRALDAIQFGTQSQGDVLTGKSCMARFFRTNANDAMAGAGVAKWLEGRTEKSWDSIAADYTYGRDSTQTYQQTLAKHGGTGDKELYAPLGTTDFGSFISDLNGGDGLFIVESGSDASNFYKQALQFGLFKKYKTAISNAGGINTSTFAAVGNGLAGQWGATLWTSTVDTQQTRDFVAAYKKDTGKLPADFAGNGYIGMQTLFAGVRKAGTVDTGTVAKALEGLTFETLQGKVTMRAADHQMLVPVYIGQAVIAGGQPELKVSMAVPASETTPVANSACQLK